jgi:hypothetical protein
VFCARDRTEPKTPLLALQVSLNSLARGQRA